MIGFVGKFESILGSSDAAKELELARSNPSMLIFGANRRRWLVNPKIFSGHPFLSGPLEEIAVNFNRTWKAVLSTINTTVIHAFPNFQNGSRILQALFTRLVVYYQSFVDLWQRRFGPDGAGAGGVVPVNLQTVLVELKVRFSRDRDGHATQRCRQSLSIGPAASNHVNFQKSIAAIPFCFHVVEYPDFLCSSPADDVTFVVFQCCQLRKIVIFLVGVQALPPTLFLISS